ncbi:MAG: response regulator [Candidatus Acidiferrales bacterium]
MLLPAIAPSPVSVESIVEERPEPACQPVAPETLEPSANSEVSDNRGLSSPLPEIWLPAVPTPSHHVSAQPASDDIDMSDPLAILQQAIDPSFRSHSRSNGKTKTLRWVSRPFDSVSASTELDDATIIGAKVHCEVSVPGTFLTETMDLEAIAASAREVVGSSGSAVACVEDEQNSSPSEAAIEELVAEVSAVAEEFVAEQVHHVQPAHNGTPSAVPCASAVPAAVNEPPRDRRRKRRAMISAPIRIRLLNNETNSADEIATTVDVSRTGILFHSRRNTYTRGMEVAVVFPYSQSPAATHIEQTGRVVRINDLDDGTHDVAIALSAATSEDSPVVPAPASSAPATKKPMVLAVDADESLRDALKSYLQNEGYDVIAVNNASDAREVLNIFTPALIIAEVEGEGTPGYDLCSYVKSSAQWRRIPVVLTTSSAYPSDYSNAHSLGAIVCMAKPYKQERLGHIVRLLAPLPEHLQNNVAPHAADPTRVPGRDGNWAARNLRLVRGNGSAKKSSNSNGSSSKIRFRFPSFR